MNEWLEQAGAASGIDAETLRQIIEAGSSLILTRRNRFAVMDALAARWPVFSFDMADQSSGHGGYIKENRE